MTHAVDVIQGTLDLLILKALSLEQMHGWGITDRIQRMSRKWASCSTRGRCTFASDLLAESGTFQDYVIVHELLHLRYHSHGRVFKALMSAYVPGWQAMETRRSR